MTKIENEDIKNDFMLDAKDVLKRNDHGEYTIPSKYLYPHQWFWDSCFIAIGLRHQDPERAKTEILSLLKGQWKNGMIPNIVFNDKNNKLRLPKMWRSQVNPFSPDDVVTSGITQPPMLAEAVIKIGEKLDLNERKIWYRMVFPKILKYHEWLYDDRDPHGQGLALLIHPWESGLDNTPPWISELHTNLTPKWIQYIQKTKLDYFYGLFRIDTKFVPANQRMNNSDSLALYSLQRKLRKKQYMTDKIIGHNSFAIEDLTFNSILVRGNYYLRKIAKSINKEIPKNLLTSMDLAAESIEQLWDESSAQYYSRDFATHNLIKVPSIATLIPLYSGVISKDRAEHLVKLIEDHNFFSMPFPIPSVPVNSEWFNPISYWQGPTWINMNWLIIEGLKNYGFNDHAKILTKKTLELVEHSGFSEYFNPIDGSPLGVDNFSWTAALSIDLLND